MEKKNIQYAIKNCGQLGLSVKDVDTSKRIVTGFYNTYNFVDSQGDILLNGCAKKSIAERGVNSQATAKIKHAMNHDLTQLPGKIITLEEKTLDGMSGIYFETKMSDTTLGNDTLKNYLEGVYDNHSIGFRYVNYQFLEKNAHGNSKMSADWKSMQDGCVNPEALDKLDCVLLVKEINLFEGSTVAFGANSLTPYLGVKSEGVNASKSYELMLIDRLSKLESTFKNGTQSDDALQIIGLQVLQLKEIMSDLCGKLVLPIDKPVNNIITEELKQEINFSNLAKSFKL